MKMHKIQKLQTKPDFTLLVLFENGIEKIVDCKPYLQFPVFQPLKIGTNFDGVSNHGHFIEWPTYEIDISADTLWADGVTIS
jgi:hypothetical protein